MLVRALQLVRLHNAPSMQSRRPAQPAAHSARQIDCLRMAAAAEMAALQEGVGGVPAAEILS